MAVVGAIGALAGGVMGFMQSSYQAQVANANAKIAQVNADRARARSAIEGEDNDQQTAALLGEQEVQQAASGVSVGGKSQIMTRLSARRLGRRDTLNIINAGEVERYNYLTQKMNFKAEASAAKMSGVGSLVGGFLGAAGSIPSLAGGSTSTATPYKYIPQPIQKPTMLQTYVNPLIAKKPSWATNRGML